MRHDNRMSEFSSLGKKSCDAESLSYVPSIFEFTSFPVKRRLVSSAKRYEAVKRRRLEKNMSQPQVQSESEYSDNDDQISQFSSVEVQTDLNMATLAALENYEQRSREIKQLTEQKNKIGSYPTQENLRNDEKLLKFYTGLSSFRVFIAILISFQPQFQ